MKRSQPPKRSTARIPRYAELPRSTKRIRSRKADPKKRRFASLRDPGYCKWIRTFPCILWNRSGVECSGQTECAHVRSRGVGGPDVANTVPLCTRHHRESHRIGVRTFEAKYGVNLVRKALYFDAIQPPKCERDFPERFGGTAAGQAWVEAHPEAAR